MTTNDKRCVDVVLASNFNQRREEILCGTVDVSTDENERTNERLDEENEN